MRHLIGATMLLATAVLPLHGIAADKKDDATIARGRYLAKISGCNDCHTPDYAMSGGQVPESQWLVGSPVGWRGPWGTTYPSNLRLVLAGMSEDEWLKSARKPLRPPMPWFTLRDMSDADLRSLYRFVRSLGPAGQPAPAYVQPNQAPAGPVITFPSPPPEKAAAR
jgi:mono/diheme cytochrome c family protein